MGQATREDLVGTGTAEVATGGNCEIISRHTQAKAHTKKWGGEKSCWSILEKDEGGGHDGRIRKLYVLHDSGESDAESGQIKAVVQ